LHSLDVPVCLPMPTRKEDIKTGVGLERRCLWLHVLLGRVTTRRCRAGSGAMAGALPGRT